MRLEDLQTGAALRGVLPDALVTIVSVQWFGSEAVELTYKTAAGTVANELLYRHDEARLEIVERGRPWSFDGDGALFRLVSEAQRIRLAHLFDPVLAVHTSDLEPLPHLITAVYEAMLPRQPLRFLLADDPGAGKTIMAGLLIRELIARGDLERCLVVCPGSLAEQWQDELYRRFHLPFEILTRDKLEAARTGNWFLETAPVIARLDMLSRNEDLQAKLEAPDCGWDLAICDEAHKLSATFFGGEVNYTKRYRLGQLLSSLSRHFPLMTATPHEEAGKTGARLNSGEARKRADTLQSRLERRLADLKLEAQISPLPPVVLGGVLVVPAGLIAATAGQPAPVITPTVDLQERAARARAAVMAIERARGFEPTDRELEKLGYDIESRIPNSGRLRFIEVKGRDGGAETVTVTRNEILYSLNKPEDFILAIVEFHGDDGHRVRYVRQPFQRRLRVLPSCPGLPARASAVVVLGSADGGADALGDRERPAGVVSGCSSGERRTPSTRRRS